MGFVDNVKKRALERRLNQAQGFDSKKVTNFLEAHSYFISTGFNEIDSAIRLKTTPSSESVEQVFMLYDRAVTLASEFNTYYEDGVFLIYADLIFDLREFYEIIVNAFYLMGYSDGSGFTEQDNYVEYTIRQYDTLRKIAEVQLGNPDLSGELIKANKWLTDLTPEQYRFRTIKIPKRIKKASISKNLGDESWGVDLPDSIETEDGDLKVLTYKESLLQDVTNIVCYGLGSVPEDRYVGNAFINQIGQNYIMLNPLIAAKHLEEAVLLDEAVDKFSISDINIEQDAISAKITIKPINSQKVYELTL